MSTGSVSAGGTGHPAFAAVSQSLYEPAVGSTIGFTASQLHFVLGNDPAGLAPLIDALLGHMERFASCTERCRIAVAMALEEAFANALFHGNLEVSSELREGDGRAFYRLAKERRRKKPYRDRQIEVTARFALRRGEFVVRDEGPGFDKSKLPDLRSAGNIGKPSGRGVMMMRWLMDEVAFNSKGNEVRMAKAFASDDAAPKLRIRAEIS